LEKKSKKNKKKKKKKNVPEHTKSYHFHTPFKVLRAKSLNIIDLVEVGSSDIVRLSTLFVCLFFLKVFLIT
jgi:hypothetical protein